VIAIIKYNAGNILSVSYALDRLGCKNIITDDPEIIQRSEKVILPGVGEAHTSMQYLRDKELDKTLLSLKQPTLGICLGMHLMCSFSEEGHTACMNIFPNKVQRFNDEELVPHMGWNNFSSAKGLLLHNVKANENVYYVHSYYACLSEFTKGECDYINPFSATLERDNFFATQFHPERSSNSGKNILRNFLSL
tara:strand:+ start:1663 stop:2241 length:579 start_codon:yes stop_codon:yes gene_type:complete